MAKVQELLSDKGTRVFGIGPGEPVLIAALGTVTKRSYYFDKCRVPTAPVSSLTRHGRVRYGRKPGSRLIYRAVTIT